MAGAGGDPQDPQTWEPWPGWTPATSVVGPPSPGFDLTRPMTADDLDGVWRLDFHHPRGIVPLALPLLDHLVAGSQQAVAELGSGSGFTARLLGTHVYYGAAHPRDSGGTRAGAAGWGGDPQALQQYAQAFPARWAADAAHLDARLRGLETVPQAELERAGRQGIADYLRQALLVHREAWRIHFATMYRLLAVHAHLLHRLHELGLDDVTVAGLLQGEDNAVLAADADLRGLVALARELGLTALFEAFAQADPDELQRRLTDDPAGPGAVWWKAFEAFLDRHGHRGEAGAELVAPPWYEDPTPALALIRRQLVEAGGIHRRTGPDEASDRVREALPPASRARFDDVLALARRANFAWWNEEHNVVIDLRAHLPVRRAALAGAVVLGLPRPDDALYLHLPELQGLLAGEREEVAGVGRVGPGDLAELADARRAYVAHWLTRRPGLPVTLGAGPEAEDPVLREILGGRHPSRGAGTATLTGLGVSPGLGRGRARVLATLRELADVEHGEVLVCEATSPAWTPVFDRIAACVCDQGGMLTHAAIIAREYGVPAVCGVAGASTTIRTGDLVEVDGTAGEVRVVRTVR